MRRLAAIAIAAAVASCHPAPPARPLPPLPRVAYAAYFAGKLAMARSDWPAAIDALATAAEAAPDQPMIAVELARAQVKAKRDGEARTTLAAARARWPSHPEVWLVSGDVLAASAPAEAARSYRRAIELEPDNERGYLGLVKVEPATADATLHTLIARVPASVDGHYQLARRFVDHHDLPAAMSQLRAVLERDPDHIDARIDLARLLRRGGQLAAAIAETRSAFDRAGQPLDLAEELFWLLCEADDREAAIDLLTLLDDDRSDADALAMVARLDRGLGRLAEARAVAARIAAIDPDAGTIVHGELDVAAGDLAGAVKRVLAIEPASAQFAAARRLAAEALLGLGEPARALEVVKPARDAKPADLDLAVVAAYALADTGAAAQARALVDSLGTELPVRLARARLEDHLGEPAAALAILEPIIRANPDVASALNLAGYLVTDAKRRLPEAEVWLGHARELAPGDPAILDSWGWLLLRRGRAREAIRVLDRAARLSPREPEIVLHLATAWAADDAPAAAAGLLDRAAALHPTPAVRTRIDALRSTLPSARCYDYTMKRWIVGAVLLAATGCKNAPSEDQCKQLLDHLVELEFKKAGTAAATAKQKQEVTDAKSADFIDTCTKKTAKGRVECAIAAPDLDAVAKCDEAK